jgi:predicted AlkP superfamily phosphohydrolase/phosphomutase
MQREGIFGYVDPGAGFVFLQSSSLLWAAILGALGFFVFFFRLFSGFIKKFLWLFLILSVVFIIGIIMMNKPATRTKVIILGIDAMDAGITEQLMNEGRLANLSRLKSTGAYSALATSVPAESVVAWTNFAAGLGPGGHGIFDFVMRKPEDYSLYLSLNETLSEKGKIGIKSCRKADAFWNILSRNKIPCFIYFCPNTFPPEPVFGRMLSGMGVPDILGITGKFSFYTTKGLTQADRESRGRVIHLRPERNTVITAIYGPKVSLGSGQIETSVPLKIVLEPEEKMALLQFQNQRIILKKGIWSDWQRISFSIGLFKKSRGAIKFYLKSVDPEFELYASPINFDPENPLFPVSYPRGLSKRIARKCGLYHTQGMPHDTWALSEGRFDEKAFLEQADEILNERTKILNSELTRHRSGLFFFYLDTLDILQHMFWRYVDPESPLYEKDSVFKDIIYKYYEKIDQVIGEVMKGIDKETILLVISDHGFSSFRRAVNLNRWLLENGYLSLNEGAGEGKEFFKDVNWSKTKAYALGFGGIYLNRRGREYFGIVGESESGELKQKIKQGLTQFVDPQTNRRVVKNIYSNEEVFQGPYSNSGPDLFAGFADGYRASWQTALGGAPQALIEDNKKKWSGDHLIDPALVPGVVFVNRKLRIEDPSLVDIAPTLLNLFNIAKPKRLHGRILFKDEVK